MIDLLKFCDKISHNTKLHKPFTVDNWTYATNGIILIRVPKRKEWPDNTGPQVEKLDFTIGNKIYHDLILPTIEWEYCDDQPDFDLCGVEDCACECRYVRHERVEQTNGFFLSSTLIYLIKDLPNLKTYWPTYEESVAKNPVPMFFMFDNGQGLAMGIKV